MKMISYHGSIDKGGETHSNMPVWVITPQDSGHSRHVTEQYFVAPYVLSWWVIPKEDWDGKTGNNKDFDGIHVHVAHLDNNANLKYDALRRDKATKITREYDWYQYDDLKFENDGLEMVMHRRYIINVLVEERKITGEIMSVEGRSKISAKIPDKAAGGDFEGRFKPVWTFGQVGLRLDNIVAWTSPPVVRQLKKG